MKQVDERDERASLTNKEYMFYNGGRQKWCLGKTLTTGDKRLMSVVLEFNCDCIERQMQIGYGNKCESITALPSETDVCRPLCELLVGSLPESIWRPFWSYGAASISETFWEPWDLFIMTYIRSVESGYVGNRAMRFEPLSSSWIGKGSGWFVQASEVS